MTGAAHLPAPRPRPAFSHASEAELARIFDFYEVRWEYEPDTFPIGWSLDGDVVESFAPDFYLPELDLYVELTTLKQSLVRKKNRKLRRLRELYPDVRIKLFYARDFRMLLLKFGRLALADELSGTTGQATPPRVAAAADVRRTADGVPAPLVAGAAAETSGRAGVDGARGAEDGLADADADADADAGHRARGGGHDPAADAAGAAQGPGVGRAGEPSRVPAESRGRRRGRRRRAAARAAAGAAALAAAHEGPAASVTAPPPATVHPAGTYPA